MDSDLSNSIASSISLFKPIELSEMDRVKLMKRTDTKYWFHVNQLPSLLSAVQSDYYVLAINNISLLPYSTVYYDTPDNNMYTEHHNGRLNRYKVRRRKYVNSGISFLEVKHKNNKGATQKTRVPTGAEWMSFTSGEKDFLNGNTPYVADGLVPSLANNFSRITLVNKNFSERCTIDLNLNFIWGDNHVALDNLVIVEVKAERVSGASPLSQTLRDMHIHPSGFSKYCVGRSLTNSTLKHNAFKQKLRLIEKTIHQENKLSHKN